MPFYNGNYHNNNNKIIVLIVLILLILTGFGILWLLFSGVGVFGVSIVDSNDGYEKYDGSGSGKVFRTFSGLSNNWI